MLRLSYRIENLLNKCGDKLIGNKDKKTQVRIILTQKTFCNARKLSARLSVITGEQIPSTNQRPAKSPCLTLLTCETPTLHW